MIDFDMATDGHWMRVSETDTEWAIKRGKDYIVITFKGSTSNLDWRQNFRFWYAPYKDMPKKWFAHAGFVAKWKSIQPAVMAAVGKAVVRGDFIRFAGYSQGGALAVLAHEDAVFNYPDTVVTTITFGAPRVIAFGHNIKDRFDELFQFQHRGDLVPHVPPWIFGYHHVGDKVKQGKFSFNFTKNHMRY